MSLSVRTAFARDRTLLAAFKPRHALAARVIAREHPDGGLLLVRQDAHAHLTRPLADAWKWPLARKDETVQASVVHDDGWSAWDDAPRVDADGRPFTYRHMPPDDYRALWARGFADAWALGDWVGLLVSLHGARFFEWKKDDPVDAAVLADERARQRDALARLGWADAAPPDDLPEDVVRGFTLVKYLDGLSLFACEEWGAPWTADAPGAEGLVKITADRAADGTLTLDPWPFTVDALTVRVDARHTARTTWPDDAAYRADLARAERVTLAWRLTPA